MRTEDLLSLFGDDRWSNAACKGYVIKALQTLGYSDKQTEAILRSLDVMFSTYTVEEAEKFYRDY